MPPSALLAEYDSPDDLVRAAQAIADAGFTRAETYTPFPVEDIPEVFRLRRTHLPIIVGTCAALGAATGFGMQYFANVIHYPWIIASKPPNSWPMFIPITFECAILFAVVSGVASMLLLNRLPKLHHPLFSVEAFSRASTDRFFLYLDPADPKFSPESARHLLAATSPLSVWEVPS